MPLIKAREYVRWENKTNSTTDDDSSSNFENSGSLSRSTSKTIALSRVSSTEHIDYKSLESVMTEPKLLEIFSLFVGKHFKVEMIYFLLQVIHLINSSNHFQLDVFKKMEPAGLAGKALLMYQKFIKPESFLNLDLPQDLVAEIEEVVLNEVEFDFEMSLTLVIGEVARVKCRYSRILFKSRRHLHIRVEQFAQRMA